MDQVIIISFLNFTKHILQAIIYVLLPTFNELTTFICKVLVVNFDPPKIKRLFLYVTAEWLNLLDG
jgi:hypothetical protein